MSLFIPPLISIHAPLRERQSCLRITPVGSKFQSTLPCGSDRPFSVRVTHTLGFQSTLPCGSDLLIIFFIVFFWYFNPRSLAGATPRRNGRSICQAFQSTLPCGSDAIKTNYFSINLSQAFFANRLNSNTQEFYFDVRKLLVSHSSPGCEPKLNYMFHITSHRIILHYFSSCQSICK